MRQWNCFVCLLLLLPLLRLTAQEAAYFQQEVDYQISATLDDQQHLLHAHLEMKYTNHSPVTLNEIYFHLWPRAYRNGQTAFAQQKLRDGDTNFHFASAQQGGDLDSLNFTAAGKVLEWAFDPAHPDIAIVHLAEPLASGQDITISTPFRVRIPESFSRLGRVGTSYQMTQWYPKPAVFDRDGWHPMPYLDRGEFFSEFGHFEVTLSLPTNYIVGATGTLQTAKERQWLLEKAQANRPLNRTNDAPAFPASATEFKTIRYTAEQVHDFAWFADKRFLVDHDTLQLSPERTIDVWSFYTEQQADLWQHSVQYLKRACRFYSEKIGLYPYPQVTGVQSALSAGAGMEYPMITVIGQAYNGYDLDEVLAHEVGHNWFYGVLGSNEREHPWMDEGFNSYYEQRYTTQYYGDDAGGYYTYAGITANADQVGYRYLARLNRDQSPDTNADSLSSTNYWMTAYSKPSLALQQLEHLVGTTRLDAAMQAYYQEWQFKHPSPSDIRATFEASLGEDLDWLFEGALQSNRVVDIRRKPDTIPLPLDLYPGNNGQERSIKLRLGIAAESAQHKQLFYLPLATFNAHNGLQVGLGLHNRTLEPKRFEFALAPLYGLRSQSVNGFTGFRWRMSRSKMLNRLGVQQAIVGMGLQRFGYREFNEQTFHYQRYAAALELEFAHAPITQKQSSLTIRYTGLQRDRPAFDEMGVFTGTTRPSDLFLTASYQANWARAINPSQVMLEVEYGQVGNPFASSFTKISGSWGGAYQYEAEQFIRWRLFGAYFLQNEFRDRDAFPVYSLSLVDNAAADYRYGDLFVGRNQDPIYEQQIGDRQGGFRSPIGAAFNFGRSNNYLVAFNLDADLPFAPPTFPLGLFLDAATYDRSPLRQSNEAAFQWTGGFSLTFLSGEVGLFVPVVGSADVQNLLQQRGNLLDRVSVRLNLRKFLPWKLIDKVRI